MYMDVIIRGSKQNKLPEEYVKYLETIETNGKHEDIDIYTDIMKSLEKEENWNTLWNYWYSRMAITKNRLDVMSI